MTSLWSRYWQCWVTVTSPGMLSLAWWLRPGIYIWKLFWGFFSSNTKFSEKESLIAVCVKLKLDQNEQYVFPCQQTVPPTNPTPKHNETTSWANLMCKCTCELEQHVACTQLHCGGLFTAFAGQGKYSLILITSSVILCIYLTMMGKKSSYNFSPTEPRIFSS